ncbi:class I SAM-dependent methyltransferase [Paenibacillus alkalitolerans]|uniref:class I SAM-dependent methyltransferase n=1 Tax=Paenibacillus alkalitolerans TaxID=2799335 RepID=UPI0018F30F4A|nr:class I SAM-dependent methyltransferase [Paenibacillus alkalitolerans]
MKPIDFQIPPLLYHWIVRPKWFTKRYIHDQITAKFSFENRSVLDFGCGTGANCRMASPGSYLGIDPDSKRIRYASHLFPDYNFRTLASKELPVENNTIDYVWIIAVLHHIPSDSITHYLKEFQRVLKNDGQIIIIEPFLSEKTPLCNRFMKLFDRGSYIREEKSYLQLFAENHYSCNIQKKFRKCFLYNELFFCAKLQTPFLN